MKIQLPSSERLWKQYRRVACLVGLCTTYFSARPALADQIWLQAYDGFGGENNPYAVALDSNGNIAVTGSSVNANGTKDIYTAKYAAGDGHVLWSARYDSPFSGDSFGTGVAVDGAGNVIVTGYSANGNNPNGNIGFNLYTVKYDSNGQFLWDHRGPYSQGRASWPGSWLVKRIAVDSDGNVIISGCSNGLAPCCQWNFYTAKYAASNGQTIWEQWYVGPFGEDRPLGLAVDCAGNVIVTGSSANVGNTYTTIETVKYAASNGQVLWQNRYDANTGGDNLPIGVAVDSNGNVLLSGVTLPCCPGVQPIYYTAKYAATSGQIVWQRTDPAIQGSLSGGISRDYVVPQSIVVDSAGNAIVNEGNGTAFDLAKFGAADGRLIWGRRFRLADCVLGSNPTALAVDGADNVIVAGDSCFPNGNCGANQLLTAKYAPTDGALVWEQTFGVEIGRPSDEFFGFSRGVAVDDVGNVVVIAEDDTAHSNFDYLTLKYVPSGSPLTTFTCPGNLVQGTDPGQCSTVVNYTPPTATDACGNLLAVTCAPPPGSVFLKATTPVTCTASDGTSCSFTVTINDTEAPSVTCPANVSISCSVNALAAATFAATATDNCDPSPTITYSIQPGSGFPVGTTPVTCTATDSSGNQSICTFNVARAPLGFTGFLSPIGGADASGGSFSSPPRTFKLNSTIPVKFTASCGGSPVLSGIHRLQVIKYTSQTVSGTPIDATPTDAATAGDQFVLEGGEWHFNLDTKDTGMTTGIWLLRATLSDGSQHTAWIQVK